MKIKLNGKFSKEELQEILTAFDKPRYEIKLEIVSGITSDNRILLYDYEKQQKHLFATERLETTKNNLSTVSKKIATIMDDLMETKDILNNDFNGYYIYYSISTNQWEVESTNDGTIMKHFKTKEKAILAAKLLNKYHKDNKMFGFKLGDI